MILGHHITIAWKPGEPLAEIKMNGDKHPYHEAIAACLNAAVGLTENLKKDSIRQGRQEQIIDFKQLVEQLEILIKDK